MNKQPKAQQLKKGAALRRAILGGLGVLVAIPAIAQTSTNETVKLNKTIVTGSNIPLADNISVVPVDTYSAKDIEQKGAATVEQLVKQLPSAIGAGNYGISRGNGGDGTAGVALRGIPDGTLLLLNGRRLALDDLNIIPVGAIERIEVLKDGASANYGADAIAGVVNIITKKDFNGFEANFHYGNTTSTDVGEQQYSFVAGVANEKTSVLLGGSYFQVNALYSKDRERSLPDLSDPLNLSGTSNPGRIRTSPAGAGGIPGGGLVYRGAAGTTGRSAADYSAYRGAADNFPYPLYTPAVRPADRYNIFGQAEHTIFGENLKWFSEGFYTRGTTFNQLAPTPIVFQNLTTATSPNGIVIPATNPYNVFGVPITNMRYRTVELGPRTDTITSDTFRFVSGLKGRIGDSTWNWESAVMYTEDRRYEVLGGELSRAALERAVADVNPATAFNPFGNAANTAAALGAVKQNLTELDLYKVFSVDAKANGEIVDLPGGPLAMAVGGEYRKETVDQQPDGNTVRGDTVGFNSRKPLAGARTVGGVFYEINVPITSPSLDIPGLHKLEINTAGRFDDYSDFGSTFNPKVSLRWQPLDEQVTIRSSYAESYKAPAIGDLYRAQAEDFPELRNPVTGEFTQIRTFRQGNPNLKPETAKSYTAGVVYSPKQVKNLTFTLDYFKVVQMGVPGSPDQYILNQNFATGGPTSPTAAFAQNIVYDAATQEYITLFAPTMNLSRRIVEGFDGSITYAIPTKSAGTFTLSFDGAYYFNFVQEDLPGSGLRDRLGDFVDPTQGFGLGSIPRVKLNGSLFWTYGRFELGYTAHYLGSYRDDAASGFDRAIDEYITHDLQASVNLPWKSKLTVGVINVADEQPPLVLGAFADRYDRDTTDLRQRFVYVNFNKKF